MMKKGIWAYHCLLRKNVDIFKIFLKFITDSSSPTFYLSESVEIMFIWLELMNLCYMRNGVPGPKIPYFENYKYFSWFLHILVALHRTFLNHLKSCLSAQIWWTYRPHGDGFQILLIWAQKGRFANYYENSNNPGSEKIGCDAWRTNWMKYYSTTN